MITQIVTCAMLLNLSPGTKSEVGSVFPYVANYCMEHPAGRFVVKYQAMGEKHESHAATSRNSQKHLEGAE